MMIIFNKENGYQGFIEKIKDSDPAPEDLKEFDYEVGGLWKLKKIELTILKII